MKYLFYTFLALFFGACNPTQNTEELEHLKEELTQTETTLRNALVEIEEIEAKNNLLRHDVYFNLKEGITPKDSLRFIAALKRLQTIDLVKDFRLAQFVEVGDTRAMKQYELVMQMGFENKTTMAAYQAHEVHQAVKKEVGAFLENAPGVYDYRIGK